MASTTVKTAVVGVVVVIGIAALVTGAGSMLGGGGNGEDIDSFPTETPAGSDGGDGSGDDGGATGGDGSSAGGDGGSTTSTPPFTFTIDSIENCGTTCRDVTVILTNEQPAAASDVTVYTRIYAGNTTSEDAIVWQGKEPVGGLAAGGSVERTQRVSLSYGEAYEVKQHDGWITVVTTVQSANETVTFESRRDVA